MIIYDVTLVDLVPVNRERNLAFGKIKKIKKRFYGANDNAFGK